MSTDEKNEHAPPPSQLAGFALLEKIGEGGMGVVYRAKQVSLDRIVALKILTPKLSGDAKYRDSFVRESKAAARLHHSNIVSVFDAGVSEGFFYYAMELVEGETLLRWVQREGALPEKIVLELALCVGGALKFGWDREQLVHRDVKPENIMVDRDGNVKLCDLGLAKSFGETTLMSLSGNVFGTPNYMSPEQARSELDVDYRSDIYSMGLTIYHAITAQIPFHGGVPTLVMARHITEQLPDLRAHAPDASVHIVRIVQRMLAKEIAERYQNWDEVLRDLELARNGKPPLCPLIFKGNSTMKREVVAPAPISEPSPAPTSEETAPQLFDVSPPPPPTPRVKSKPAAPPPPQQPDDLFETTPAASSAVAATPPRKRNTSTVFLVGVAIVFLLGVVGILGYNLYRLSADEKNAKKPQQIVSSDGKPVATTNNAAAVLLGRAEEFGSAFPTQHTFIIQRYQAVIDSFPNSTEAARAAKLIVAVKELQAAAEAQQTLTPEQRAQAEEQQFQSAKAFAEFAEPFLGALRQRDYAAAEDAAKQSLDRPELAPHLGALRISHTGAMTLRKFWDGFPRNLEKLKDQQLTLQGVTGTVEELTPTEIKLRVSSAPRVGGAIPQDIFNRMRSAVPPRAFPIAKIPYADLFRIIENVYHVADREAMLGVAWFCFAEGNFDDSERYLKAAERTGEDILSTQVTMNALSAARPAHDAHRLLRELRVAFAEKKFDAVRAQYNELTAAHANSDLVRRARAELDPISEWVTAELARRIEQEKREQEERTRLAAERAAQEERRVQVAQAFAEFLKDFRAALSERNFVRAQQLTEASAENQLLESQRDTLKASADTARRVDAAWKRLPDTFKGLIGKQISVGGVTGKVAEISEGEIVIEVREGVGAGVALADLGAENSLSLAALATRPNNAEAVLDLAWMYFAAGKLNAALARLDLAERAGVNVEAARALMTKLSEPRNE